MAQLLIPDLFDRPPPPDTDFAACEGCGERTPVGELALFDFNVRRPKGQVPVMLCHTCRPVLGKGDIRR